jgi:DNA-binding CsgD family transcriptional regulator
VGTWAGTNTFSRPLVRQSRHTSPLKTVPPKNAAPVQLSWIAASGAATVKRNWRDMPERLEKAVQFADDVGRLHTPLAVLVALQNVSLCTLGVQVLGAWTLPHYFKDEITDWREGENLFFHPDVPRSFWPEYLKQFAEHGYSALTLKARRTSVPFTFAEAQRNESNSQANWIFGFLCSHNIRDGLYCTYRAWAVVFISTKLLALRLSQRAFLAAATQAAIGRIEDIVNSQRKRRRGKKVDALDMTARELEVLQQRALLGSNAAIAKALNISVLTVDVHLRSARKKMKVEDTAIALLEAYKRGLIEY